MPNKLLSTGQAAAEIGVARYTLVRWWQAGTVKPALVTAGGQARWDMADLIQQLKDWRRQSEDD